MTTPTLTRKLLQLDAICFPMGYHVLFRRHKGAHVERGVIKGRTFGRPPHRYDIETEDGERVRDAVDIHSDEQRMTEIRDRELAEMEGKRS